MSQMYFQVDPHNGVPIYEQVIRQVIYAVANRSLRPGELIPSVRNLARQLTINPNTVARAYRHLQEQNVLTSHRGSGMAVSADAVEHCQTKRLEILRIQIRSLVQETQQSGIEQGRLEQLFRDEISKTIQNEEPHRRKSPSESSGASTHE